MAESKTKKRKSKKTNKNEGARPVPTEDSNGAPGPGYQLRQMQLTEERFERSCHQNYDDLLALRGRPNIYKEIVDFAAKGMAEAAKRKEGERWPLFDQDQTNASKDLPQASCILLMFHDVFQENRGKFEDTLITREMRIVHGAAISELREMVSGYYKYRGVEKEIDLFTICMVQLKKHFEQTIAPKLESDKPRGRPKDFSDDICVIASNLYVKEYSNGKDSKSAWEETASLLNFAGKGESLRKACQRYRKKLNPVNKGQN